MANRSLIRGAKILSTFLLLLATSLGCRPDASPRPGQPVTWKSPKSPIVDTRLGISAHPPMGLDPRSTRRRGHDLDCMRNAGFRVLRVDFRWHQIEPKKGQFNFSRHDALFADAKRRGIELLPVLAYGNSWASAGSPAKEHNRPPDQPADFARFVSRVVTHYRGKIDRFEIWNEPNVGFRFWKPSLGGDPQGYARLLREAGQAAHRANPKAQIAFGGTFYPALSPVIPGTIDFTEGVYRADPGIGSAYDTFAFHPYRYPFLAPETRGWKGLPNPEPFEESLSKVRKVLKRNGDASKPIWITETGWHTARWSVPFPGVSENDQARYLVRNSLLALAHDVELLIWYTLHDGPNSNYWQEGAFGLITYDSNPDDGIPSRKKPAYHAHKTLSKVLAGTHFSREMTSQFGLPRGTRALRFEGPGGRQVTALWSHDKKRNGTRVQIPIPAHHTITRQVGMTGSSTSLIPSRSAKGPQRYQVTATLSESPIYIESR